ncbi:hypothetical protein [Cohnella sp. GbtcB17]|uniref:hypothetical protein n=1 Tax=Cohnella sp. GbtcB17 TaxID=2824762 RepID=UPI0020C5CCD7|nr:hypothetical protein [Cohnella sp. GbtcB17]
MQWLGDESTSVELAELLGVTYKTAWLIGHKLRDALTLEADEKKLSGDVAVTGGVYGWRCYSSLIPEPTDQPIVIGGEMNGESVLFVKLVQMDPRLAGKSRLLTRYVYDVFSEVHVETEFKKVKSFAYRGMRSLKPLSAVLMHAMNWFDHTLQGLGPKHLQAYLHHQSFVHNFSHSRTRMQSHILRLSSSVRSITYRELTQKKRIFANYRQVA